MAQILNNQYVTAYKKHFNDPLDINTVFVGQDDVKNTLKALLFRMRNVAKNNSRLIEIKEKRKPRIQFCGYVKNTDDNRPVNVCKSDNGNLFYNGITNCGSFWRCPVCAVKISENKKELISTLIQEHYDKGFKVGFVTLTVRHQLKDVLRFTLAKLLDNYRNFQNSTFFKNFRKKYIVGQVKTLEVTFGSNGWHPHLHILYFYNYDSSAPYNVGEIEKIQKKLISVWAKYKKNGLVKSQNQQLITKPKDIESYVTKYDICMEMTKGNIKGSKGLTAHTALKRIVLGDYKDKNHRDYLFGIYSCYVEIMHGKHFVNISNSLRKLYHDKIKQLDKSDDEIVNDVTIDEVLFKITVNVWTKIAKYDLQPIVLSKFKDNGLDGVYNLLTQYKDLKDISIEIENDLPIIKNEIDYERQLQQLDL